MTLMATPLPTPETLATLVTNVTKTMFGITFSLDAGRHEAWKGEPRCPGWQAAVLPIPGTRPITVAIAADGEGCQTLAAAMFSCDPQGVDASMIRDALAEIVNIVGGQVKSALALDQALGLPKVVDQEHGLWALPDRWRSATLSRGATRTIVWVAVTEQIL